jgi:ankyrin repeat protein
MPRVRIIVLTICVLIFSISVCAVKDRMMHLEELLNQDLEVAQHQKRSNADMSNNPNSALRSACAKTKRCTVAKLLNNKQVDVNAYNLFGYAAMHCAVRKTTVFTSNVPADISGHHRARQGQIITLLTAHGADIDLPDLVEGCTPLQILIKEHPIQTPLMHLLVSLGADLNKKNLHGESVLETMQKHAPHNRFLNSLYTRLAFKKAYYVPSKQLNIHD